RETHPATDDLGVARHALAVPGGLLVARVDGDRERLDERLPQTLLLRQELRVLDRDRRRCAERGERLLVVGVEALAPFLVAGLEDPDDAAVLPGHREGQQAPRAIPAALVRLGVEARIRVRIRDVDSLARRGDRARDPHTDRLTDLADACAERDAGPDLVLLAIDDEDRRAVRIEQLR